MTPKEQYEARKAARKAARTAPPIGRKDQDGEEIFFELIEIFDRLATAVERIAIALEPSIEMRQADDD